MIEFSAGSFAFHWIPEETLDNAPGPTERRETPLVRDRPHSGEALGEDIALPGRIFRRLARPFVDGSRRGLVTTDS